MSSTLIGRTKYQNSDRFITVGVFSYAQNRVQNQIGLDMNQVPIGLVIPKVRKKQRWQTVSTS